MNYNNNLNQTYLATPRYETDFYNNLSLATSGVKLNGTHTSGDQTPSHLNHRQVRPHTAKN